jgi:hypothetical protein
MMSKLGKKARMSFDLNANPVTAMGNYSSSFDPYAPCTLAFYSPPVLPATT